jgi:hypothetical protein
MTITLTGVTVDTGVPAQNVRAQSNPVISTAGNDAQAIARQQLPSAVPAPVLLGAYSAAIAPQPKPPAKPFLSVPSSSLAAQFIAQGDSGSSDDLAIFEPPPLPAQTTSEETTPDDYLNELRIARGDLSSAKTTAPTQASEQAQAREAVQNAKLETTVSSEMAARSGIAQLASALTQYIRRPGITQAKGVGAYQLAQTRNAMLRNMATPVAEPAS